MKSFTFLSNGGAMGQLIRDRDWAATPLGEPAQWPASLKTAVAILLSSGYPMYIAWGSGFTQIYNDAYRPILGSTKHPAALGTSTVETFREIWDFIGPMFRDVMETGRASTYVDQLLLLERHGFREECYFTFSYSAIPSEEGIGGVLVTCLETTDRVIQERRLRVLRDLLEARTCDSLQAIAQASAEALAGDRDDLPFALFFEVGEDGSHALCCHHGLQGEALAGVEQQLRGRLAGAALGAASLVELPAPVDTGLAGADPVQRVACIGVAAPGRSAPQLVLAAGLSPRLEYSQRYDEFVRGVTANIGTVIAEVEALEHERRRSQELAEIDRAKTVFFSDVSHEFRTPIALMLGPIEEAIEATSGAVRENLLIARRNTARLLKLVNSLLDFSRIEAGRMQANFEGIDLARFTCELASNFRSATDRAGIALVVDAPPLAQPVGIDPSMWEKIVLNLLSNAFKHTFEGEIRLRLRQAGGQIRLEVADTGVGIPEAQVAHVFERFHRVPNARSRTHEGSGIGLALVRELARMHGGDVDVASREGEGSLFTVTVRADLQQARPPAQPAPARPQVAAAYVEEALRWLPGEPAATGEAPVPAGEGKVLVVDDNADMREYLRRVVAQRWVVRTAPDGEDALAQARDWLPDVIVSDVMMPRLDGFALIRRLREHEATAAIPVLLLSARAGEDARIDGMRAGADDYLVKPFGARDLLARIEAQLARSRGRRGEQEARLRLSRLFEQAPVAIALLQCPDFTYTIANRPYRELVGRDQLLGRTVRQALPELEGQGIYEALEQVRVTQTPFVGESTHLNLWRKGIEDEGWFTFLFQPIVDPTGTTEAVLVIVYEVTELARAKQAAEVANVAKDEFLAMLGHELRNPLAPIVTALQIMSLRDGGEPTRERQIIERQVKHLMRLVDDLLDVSRVTQGKLELKREGIEIAQVVGDAVEQVKPLLERRKQAIEVAVAASGLAVDGDPKRLAQVVSNLLTNASKFSGEGARIRVAAAADRGQVVLRVIDQGIGLAASQLPRVFDVFYQGRQTFDRSEGGLGLGLAIVRNIVALHGGTVSAESAGPGQGSEFVVRLPLLGTAAGAQAHRVPASAAPPVPCKRILVVDDNRDAADTLAELLKLHGHATRVAFDAPTALELAAEFRPEAAFLDLGLPGMSGYELAQALWALPQLGTLPVFAVSGYGQAEDRKRTAHQGFTGHLVKPVSSEQLAATLREIFRPQAAGS